MDFFYHHSPITTNLSVEIVDDGDTNLLFFDRVNVGSEDLARLFSGPLLDLAVNITPELMHPALPPAGLTCWAAPADGKVRQGPPPLDLSMRDLAPPCSMDVPCVSLPHHCSISSSHHS